MKILFLLPGIMLGAAEFFLTKQIADRVLHARAFVPLLLLKLGSYGCMTIPVFLCRASGWFLPFGIGLGGGILASAFANLLFHAAREKR